MSDAQLKNLCDQVKQAHASGTVLRIEGTGSKAFYGNAVSGEQLSTSDLSGIVQYDPTELVITAKAGTPVAEVEAVLAEQSQMFAFEPPLVGGRGTIGGMVATALAGPARPWRGAVRDYLLGVKVINGKGELLRFGGQVMKNVAGYDVSRLMVGSMGCLGVLAEVSIKVLPKPEGVRFCRIEGDLDACIMLARTMMTKMTPLSGVSYDGQQGRLRVAGGNAVLERFIKTHNLAPDHTGQRYWQDLRHHSGCFFEQSDDSDSKTIWMLSLPRWSQPSFGALSYIMDWAGARYWIQGGQHDELQKIATDFHGHLTCYKSRHNDLFATQSEAVLRLHQSLKHAYDPKGIFNPGRLYADL